MRVLFCISVLALVALLWASFAMVRHVRRARRRPGDLEGDAKTDPGGSRNPETSKKIER